MYIFLKFYFHVSRPDLFHLSLWLPPPTSRCHAFSPLDPGYLFRCSLFVLSSQVNQRVFPFSCFFLSLLLVFLVLILACLQSEPTWLTILHALTLSLPATLYLLDSELVYDILPVHDQSLAWPLDYNKYQRLEPSASLVCIWVPPCALISWGIV